MAKVLEDTNTTIQKLNDKYTNPAGSEDVRCETDPLTEEQAQAPDISGSLYAKSPETAATKDPADA